MKIRNIVQDGLFVDAYIDLMHYCFGLDQELMKEVFKLMFDGNETEVLGVLEEDTLMSALIINDYKMFLNGQVTSMGGIGGVVSSPEARENHYVAKLLKYTLEKMKDKGMSWSMLAPFSYSFYNKYGWEWSMNVISHEIKIDDLAHFKNQGFIMKPLSDISIDALNQVYKTCYGTYNGTLDRRPDMWKQKMANYKKDKIYTYGAFDTAGHLSGYLFYKLEEGKFVIQEYAFNSIAVEKQLYHFVYVHRAQVKKMLVTVAENSNVLNLLKNPRQTSHMHTGMMIRVVDVKKVLLDYRYQGQVDMSFSLEVIDKLCPWNHQKFDLDISDGKAQVAINEKASPDIVITISSLSQVLFGFRSFSEVLAIENENYKNNELISQLDKCFPKQTTYINDFF